MNIVLPTLHVRRSAQAVPLAAASLAAALPEELRQSARLLDLFPDMSEDAMLEAILAAEPALVAFPLYLWNRGRILALARRLKASRPAPAVIAGGPEATVDPEGVLAEGMLDAVIRGEGELAFRELLGLLSRGEPLRPLAGVTLPGRQGPASGPDRSPAETLDELPSPWLTGVLRPREGAGVLWETSRGCPFACDFCYDARGSRGVRAVSDERLQAELELFVRSGVAQVWVLDSTFNFPPERGKRLLRLLAEKAPHIHFHLEAKADFIDRETARLLSRVSCSVQIGLQSARPEVLRHMHRTLDPRLFAEKLHLLAAEGVTFGLDLIYGLPGDDHRGFRHSLDTALELAPNHVDIFPLAVLPGTALHRDRHRFDLKALQAPPYEILESATYTPAELAESRLLSAAADLFYNLGRAVAFFPALLRATGKPPVDFLEGFADWALAQKGITTERFLKTHRWQPAEIRELQEGYASRLLEEVGRRELQQATLDLIRYHFHYAETLLDDDTWPAPPEMLRGRDLWETRWQTAPSVRLVPFTYEILDLLEMEEVDLEQFASLFRPVGSVALFFRREFEVFCESLEEDFLRLLRGCDGQRSPREIFGGSITQREGEEIVEFAVAEGFLIPAATSAAGP